MHLAEHFDGFFRGTLHRRRIGDVHQHAVRLSAGRPQLRESLFEVVGPYVGDGDLHARLGRTFGDAESDAAAAAGDESDFPS